MQNSQEFIYYNENFIERINSDIFLFYDLWSVRPLQSPTKEFISGNCKEFEKFSEFIEQHSNKDYACDLLIFVGDGEKKYPTIMYNRTKKYFIVKFPQNTEEYIGTPLHLPYMNR